MNRQVARKRQGSAFALSAIAAAVVSTFALTSAYAQEQAPAIETAASVPAPSDDNSMAEIIVTGSAIKRTDAETAVPLTILKADELRTQGLTTVEQILGTLSGMQTQVTSSQAVGSGSGGASLADMHGLGPSKTLVLLNGRRIANNSVDGSAPDLNMIPMAAIERVEVLRDGASSLYGTDAIGGVINFITKKNYSGGTVTLGYDDPQHPGGDAYNANLGGGYGDLETQGFNIFGFLDLQKQKAIGGTDRPFNTRFPGGLSASPSPANYYQDGSVVGNPVGPDCTGAPFLIPAGDGSCYMTTSSFVDYVPKSDRESGFLRGQVKLGSSNVLSAEYFHSKADVYSTIAGVPYGLTYQNPTRPDGTPNPYYPGNPGNSFTPAFTPNLTFDGGKVGQTVTSGGEEIQPGYMIAKWRDIPNGPRAQKNVNTQDRIVLALDGSAAGWDYGAGLNYNRNKVDQKLTGGYNNGNLILEGILNGVINPYGDQSDEGMALINSALLTGLLQTAEGKTQGADAHASRQIGDWFGNGKQSAFAVGAEFRHEDFVSKANTSFAEKVVASTGVDPAALDKGTRDVYGIYTQLDVPVAKTLDVSLSVRYDKYSDFGDTTNPKISFRYQPVEEFLVRGAYSTGFRAPSLYELNGGQAYTNTSQVDDPITCPKGVPTGPAINNCSAQFQTLLGGNKDLQPEKSKSFTLGFVVEPIKHLSFSVDYWNIRVRDQIGSIADDTLFDVANVDLFSTYFHRDLTGHLSTDGTACPGTDCGYVDQRNQNLGSLKTDGIDFNAAYRLRTDIGQFALSYNSTMVHRYDYQDYKYGPYNQNVGQYIGAGPIFRWKHTLALDWKLAAFSAGAVAHYKSGYHDVVDLDGNPHNVASYTTFDVYGGWTPVEGLDFTLGIRNLTDRDPPLTYQDQVFQSGYDPRFYDPTGRVYYVRASYNFNM